MTLDRVSKRFGATQALDQVSVEILPGEVHALVGENGAGKSTLGKIVGGIYTVDSGVLRIDTEKVEKWNPPSALAAGIVTIQQELSLVPARSVADNVFLGIEDSRFGVLRGSQRERYERLEGTVGFGIPHDASVDSLRLADQQKVEILRALARDARLIVMDEPTSSLTKDEASRLHEVIARLSEEGRTIVYVSHFLDDVLAVANRVTVMRDGKVRRTSSTTEETKESLIEGMLGGSFDATLPELPPLPDGRPVVLEIDDISGVVPQSISFDIREGEVVGLAGLVGSGRSELARVLFGVDPLLGGEIRLRGRPLMSRSPRISIDAGIGMLPEDRRGQGLVMSQNVRENVTLPRVRAFSRAGMVNIGQERVAVKRHVDQLGIVPPDVDGDVRYYSGGNQQKALFAKWTAETPEVIIFDEPTRGIDVGAKRTIYQAIVDVARAGAAVLLISSELEEVVHLSHRIVFMANGRMVGGEQAAGLSVDEALRRLFEVSGSEKATS